MKKITILFLLFVINTYSQTLKDTLITINSKAFQEKREIQIHFPKNFDRLEKLPVIYVFDAQWKPYFKLTTSIVDYLTEIKEFPKSIVVGVNSKDRKYELTPEPVNEDWKMPTLGGAKLLESHLQNEVFTLIDSLFNVSSNRIGIGHSLGGTFLLNSIIDNPNLFNSYIAISPNLYLDEEEIVLKFERNKTKIKDQNKFVYASIGAEGNVDKSFLPSLCKLDMILSQEDIKNINWQFYIYNGFNHATIPLEGLHKGLLALSTYLKENTVK